ncbi:MAG: Tetratricopeptide (TPR) repeat [Verrucomicrobia bacterium]|jgi:tetratricopeptide (TPR) repeat protein|nr:MAG: Tetratricopeptide (TPR) repeat [Verrucomicrobiota bacterium]
MTLLRSLTAVIGLSVLPLPAATVTIETAIARTVTGDLAGAEQIYREIARQDPERGLPALARFLSLTDGGRRLPQFLAEIATDRSVSPILQARVLLESGETERAIGLLRDQLNRPPSADLAWFAAGTFARAGLAEEAGRLYLERFREATDAASAREALRGLLPTPGLITPSGREPMERWFLGTDLSAEERLAFLDHLARNWPAEQETSGSPFSQLLASAQAFHCGELESALKILPLPREPDAVGKLWALQRIRVLSRLGRSQEAGQWSIWWLGQSDKVPESGRATDREAETRILAALDEREPGAAERAIQLIRMRPHDPEPMRHLIRFFRETGTGHPGQLPELAAGEATNPEWLGQCGYVLATEGFPAEGLACYDRALAIDPEDPFILLNRAACLTRLGRAPEAVTCYRHVLESGHKGRPYHLHELILRLWVLAQEADDEPACLAYFQTLTRRRDVPWHPQIGPEIASVLLQFGLRQEAARFSDPSGTKF